MFWILLVNKMDFVRADIDRIRILLLNNYRSISLYPWLFITLYIMNYFWFTCYLIIIFCGVSALFYSMFFGGISFIINKELSLRNVTSMFFVSGILLIHAVSNSKRSLGVVNMASIALWRLLFNLLVSYGFRVVCISLSSFENLWLLWRDYEMSYKKKSLKIMLIFIKNASYAILRRDILNISYYLPRKIVVVIFNTSIEVYLSNR